MPDFDAAEVIETRLDEPLSASADGQSASNDSIPDKIKGAQFVAGSSAVNKRRRGISFSKLIAPGAASDSSTLIGGG